MAYSASYGGGGGGGGGGGYGGYSGEYTTTSYGAQGGNDGGGFMAGSQPGGSQKPETAGKDTLRACTILQIHGAEPNPSGEGFMIDNAGIGFASIVGQVRAATRKTIGNNYTLDDGTSSIEARQWTGGGELATHDADGNPLDPQQQEENNARASALLEVGQWAKVFGAPHRQGAGGGGGGGAPRRIFNIKGIRPIQDKNEISHHLLEATVVHLFYTRGPPGQGGGGKGDDGGLFVKQDGDEGLEGVSAMSRKMFAWLKRQEKNNEGFHAQNIAAAMGVPAYEIMQAGEELSGAGKICATVDDQTWQVIDF